MADESPVVRQFLTGDAALLNQVLNESWLPPKEFNEKRLRYYDIQAVDEYDRNTKVTVQGTPAKGYYGDVVQYYNRLDVAVLFPDLKWSTPRPITRENVFPYLKASTGLDITIDDLAEFDEMELEDGQEVTILLDVAPNSLQYNGKFNVTIKYGPSWLDLMVYRTELDVLRHPSKKYDMQYGRMAAWGYDFAFHYDDLKPNKTGYMTNYTKVNATCRALGFPNFANNRIYDAPTKSVPNANPAFERVFVMDSPGSGLTGPMYFHYNPY